MRLLILQILYIGTILSKNKLERLLKKHSKYEFHVYDNIYKEFIKVYYSNDINQFVIESDNVIFNCQVINQSNKLEIQNIWNLEN